MMTFERFEELTYELAQQLPEEFFRKLDGGVMAREGVVIHPAAKENDLLVMGEYHRTPHLGRFVVLYYGSFMRAYGYLDEEGIRKEMWRVLRHEFLHHLESLAGENSLEIEDAVRIAAYQRAHSEGQES
ncbi:MAG: metallopeptidase family protein [Lachnospiraceae bacterium]|nr:metallopeptidase family protein [Lachnospiraceae bacterium]